MTRRAGWMASSMFLLFAVAVGAQPPQPPAGPGGMGRGGGVDRPQMPARDGGLRRVEAPKGTGIIRGTVVAADNGSPIRRAQVRLNGQGVPGRLSTSDDRGRFEIKDLPAGRYQLTASKGGFVTLEYGQRRPAQSGTPIELGHGQVMEKVVIGLPRGSVISGRITDEFGEPLANSVVTAMRYTYQAGERRLLPATGSNSRDTTDDQGQFRLFGLPPGDYVVSAAFRVGGGNDAANAGAEVTGYAPTYFPGTSNPAEAQRVHVDVSQEQSGIVFSLIATRLVRVSGTVLDAQGSTLAGGIVTLVSASGSGPQRGEVASSRVDNAGQFRLIDIAPGRYLLNAASSPRGGGRGGPNAPAPVLRAAAAGTIEAGTQELVVGNDDVTGVVIATAPGARVSGVVVTDTGTAPAIRAQQVTIGSRALGMPLAGRGQANVRINDDWTFQIDNLFQPRIFRANLPEGWTLKQVLLNGDDITDTPTEFAPGQSIAGMQVVITQRLSRLSGRITDTRGTAITDASVVVFPADERRWTEQSRFVRAARPDQDGNFQFADLPPLDRYLAVVVQDLEDGQASDPEFLARVRDGGTAFSLSEGETRALDLRFDPR